MATVKHTVPTIVIGAQVTVTIDGVTFGGVIVGGKVIDSEASAGARFGAHGTYQREAQIQLANIETWKETPLGKSGGRAA